MALSVELHKKFKGFQMDVAFEHDGGSLGILGGSGMGKSMTLKMIAGLVKPDSGKVIVDGRIVYDSAAKIDMPARERHIGYLFQQYALFPTMTVTENIGIAMKKSGDAKKKEIDRLLEQFALQNLGDRMPNELSGGQQQRVALARILASEPQMLLLDEPFSALDEFLKDKLQQELMEMLEDYPGTVILVSHSRDEIYRFSEELVIMDKGKVVCAGKTEEIFAYPEWKEAARLTGCKNITKVIREDAHHLQVPAWEICLALKQEISEEIQYIGIRAHDFVPVWDEISDEGKRNQEKANENLNNNRIPVKIESVAKLPFEHRFFLRISEKCREENVETEASENVCWFVQRDQWKMLEERGLPAWLYLPEEKILLLK